MGDLIGEIENPTKIVSAQGSGIFTLINKIFTLVAAVAGIFFVFQIIASGFALLSASGDPKKAEQATSRLLQSIIGLAIVAFAGVIAAVVGKLLGIDILNPSFLGPN